MKLQAPSRSRGEGSQAPLLILAALAVLGLAGCGGSSVKAERTASPIEAVTAEAPSPQVLAGRYRGPVGRGHVQVPPGPFTDRVDIRNLRFHAGPRPRVTGSMLNLVDVSDAIVLELRADFYDARGRRVGQGDVVFNDAEPFNKEKLRFAIGSRDAAPSAVAAVLTIPQLVNE